MELNLNLVTVRPLWRLSNLADYTALYMNFTNETKNDYINALLFRSDIRIDDEFDIRKYP